MSGSKVAALVVGDLTLACVAFVVVLLIVKALWAWTIPDLFPGAVRQEKMIDAGITSVIP